MNASEFNRVFKETMKMSADVLVKKAGEYSAGDKTDRLTQFKKVGDFRKQTQAQALGGMMVKHTSSIYDMIDADQDYPLAKWDEKILDHINYLILLRAIVVEEAEGNNYA